MRIAWHVEAGRDYQEAVRWYEQQAGIGWEFSEQIEETLRSIATEPDRFEAVDNSIRRCRIPRFPYDILFAVANQRIRILAIAHHRRDPSYWTSRISN